MQILFTALSYAPGPFWILILLFPTNRRAMLAVDLFLILLSVLFTFQSVPVIPQLFPLILKPEFTPLYEFLTTPQAFVASWNHFILSDLWIGRWVAQDTEQGPRPLLVRLIVIPLILLFGPTGLCCYLIWRMISRRKIELTLG